MKDYYRQPPKFKNCKRIHTQCLNCRNFFWEKPSSFKRKKRHFCSMDCYAKYRKHISSEEQPNYQGIRKSGESKYIYYKRYKQRHPEIIKHLKIRRYAKERGAEGSHTLKEWENLKLKFNYKCAHCGRKKQLTKDHIIPLSKGGSDYINNIQPLCRNCNSKKHNKLL